jgi:hypothetical protein
MIIYCEKFNFLSLHNRRCHSDDLFLTNDLSGPKYSPSLLERVSIRVHARNIRNFTMFICSSPFQLDVFQRRMQFVSIEIFLITRV